MAKQIAHWEIYKSILNVPGDIFEFGVYKAASLIRWATFREITENAFTRKIVGFDAFGKFPLSPDADDDDVRFTEKFTSVGGDGLELSEVSSILQGKRFENIKLIKGDVLKTLPDYISENTHTKLSLLHIDMDVYEPTLLVLQQLWGRLMPGGMIILDDYNDITGATRAVDEFIDSLAVKPTLRPSPFHHKPITIMK